MKLALGFFSLSVLVFYIDIPGGIAPACPPNSAINDGCNTCGCGPDGRLRWCTLMACGVRLDNGTFAYTWSDHNPNTPPCTPGQYNKGCNKCVCSQDGFEACTRLDCEEENEIETDEEIQNNEGIDVNEETYDEVENLLGE